MNLSALIQEDMFTAGNTPGCSKHQLAELNMQLVRRLEDYDYGSDSYRSIVKEFHDDIKMKIKLQTSLP